LTGATLLIVNRIPKGSNKVQPYVIDI